ncbi:MAG: hypothetical protein M0R28_20260 [Pigmentiphaga sp.]|nr:hypothetical protein [Pigmentiphaga sp.]
MIDQLKEAAKGADLNDLALDIEKLFQERLKSLAAEERLDPMLTIFAFLSARTLHRTGASLDKSPTLKAIYLLTALPMLGEDFKARMVNVANQLAKDLQR